MTPLVFVWTFDSVVKVGIIGLVILIFIISSLRFLFKTLFKKNCAKCKHCKLSSVSSCGGSNTYRCEINNRHMYGDNTYDFYVKCKDYEEE